VVIQSCLIYIAGKLWVGNDPVLRQSQPGKQAITFLLLANISMFLMNLLEAEKAGVSEAVVNFYGKKSWVFLVRSFSPLTIFYVSFKKFVEILIFSIIKLLPINKKIVPINKIKNKQ
jgi:hypothetical protein